jgi:hypothetical protein
VSALKGWRRTPDIRRVKLKDPSADVTALGAHDCAALPKLETVCLATE